MTILYVGKNINVSYINVSKINVEFKGYENLSFYLYIELRRERK